MYIYTELYYMPTVFE